MQLEQLELMVRSSACSIAARVLEAALNGDMRDYRGPLTRSLIDHDQLNPLGFNPLSVSRGHAAIGDNGVNPVKSAHIS